MTTLSNQQRILLDALRAGSVHSHDARDELRIGNPGQRIAELRELGCEIQRKMERRGRSNGCRWKLTYVPPSLGAARAAVKQASPLDVDSGSRGIREPTNDGAGVPQKGPGARRIPAPWGSAPPVVGEWWLVADYLGERPAWYFKRVDAEPVPDRQMEMAAA